ncbi:glycosyltransferase family 2 protein [Streptomyces albidocamelliae]|uniref:Glycosyltransferase family 2 protein n=1 Tax=Streptomyces albidocamelliae TaxID=2981135 RepID=A0ABY6EJ70_9ACTN|nr:glycosyltransferase family 2 protein [Streptomyces sp. HUAS 14-6]
MAPASHRAAPFVGPRGRRPCFVRISCPLCPIPLRRVESVTTTPTDVDVVLPCLNEAEALPWVLARIPAGWRAVVVDNGSTDGSAEVARALGATVVHEPRRGFGAACHAGLTTATADLVCFCDCDASLDPSLLVPFVREVHEGGADLVLGRRRPGAGVPGPSTRGPATSPWRACCAAVPACVCTTSGRCVPPAVSRCSRSASPTGAAATRCRWWCARPTPAGGSPSTTCRTCRAPVRRR